MMYTNKDRLSRAIDIFLALIGLAVLSPLMLLIAMAVRMESPGPLFFAQTRLGRGGKKFSIYKFRKFHSDAGTAGMPLTLRNDKRMTRVGSVLALTKLDELPQFYNILRGEMSFVGPRPESLHFEDCFVGIHRRLLDYKPGLFGPSQVRFRDEASVLPQDGQERFYREVLFPMKAEADLMYYQRRSLSGDLGWLLCGVLAVFGWTPKEHTREGASQTVSQSVSQSVIGSRGDQGMKEASFAKIKG